MRKNVSALSAKRVFSGALCLFFAAKALMSGEIGAEPISSESAEEKKTPWTHFAFVKLSDQWGIFPGVGLGYRLHKTHGFDADCSVYTYFHSGYCVYGKMHYLYFPKGGRFYFGTGAGIIGGSMDIKNPLGIFGTSGKPKNGVKPTLEGIIGYEWSSPCFLQLELGASYGSIPIYPILSLGLSF